MTVEQILQETSNWPPTRVDELVQALSTHQQGKEQSPGIKRSEPSKRVQEFRKKIAAVWEGSGVNVSTEQMLASLRRSRS
jgi:hypothetical protein